MEKFDPRTDQWSFVSSMKRRRAGAGIAVCEGRIYVAGKIYNVLVLYTVFLVHAGELIPL